jgi:hypothetical protein
MMPEEDEESLAEVLEDIASLLLMLHETYVGGLDDDDVLSGLLSFLHDSNLLSNEYLSIIEVERIRQKVTDFGRNCQGMSPQEFFSWLKEVACLLYEDIDGEGKEALHKLLTDHVFPSTISSSGQRHQRLSVFRLVDKRVLTCIIELEDFIRFWYCSMTLQVLHNTHIHMSTT